MSDRDPIEFIAGDQLMFAYSKLERDLTAARAECERLRADAERYRWLRRSDRMQTITVEQFGEDRRTLFDRYLDAAIDAELSKERQK